MPVTRSTRADSPVPPSDGTPPTGAAQSDVVLGEGAAMVFVPAAEVPGRPFTPGTAEMVDRFLSSPEYAALRR